METGLGRSFGISASGSGNDASISIQQWVEPLLAASAGQARSELLALSEETDLELLGEGLLSFAARQERRGEEALAAQVYAQLSEGAPETLAPGIRDRARRRLGALNGQGNLGDRAEVMARRFVREATDPSTLLAMTLGSVAYSTARAAMLSRFLLAPAGALTRGFGARALAASGAFAVEIPSFWAVNKGLRETLHPGSQSWDFASNAQELAGLALTLGALKLAGSASASLYARAGWRHPLGASLFQQGGMFTGILAGHRLETWVGLRAPSDGASTLIDSLVLLLQFNVGGRLSRELLGSNWSAQSAELEARLSRASESPRTSPTFWDRGIQPPFAMAMVGEGGPSRPVGESFEFNRPQVVLMEGGRESQASGLRWRNLLQDVVARGRAREIETLKNLLREALAEQGDKVYLQRQLERWQTRDPEEWKSGISRISEMLEHTPSVLSALEGLEGMQAFAADWASRPHFSSREQVPLRFSEKLVHRATLHNFLNELRGALAEKPSSVGLRSFLGPRRAKGDVTLFLERAESSETTVYFNWKKFGVRVRFTSEGHFKDAIEVRRPFQEGESREEIEALPPPEPDLSRSRTSRKAKPVAPKVDSRREIRPSPAAPQVKSSNFGPLAGENPTHYAMRLLEASRSPDREIAHEIVSELARRLKNPDQANFVRETVQRWVPLTDLSRSSAMDGIVAQNYKLGAFKNPITIVSLPTTFLPEAWSLSFGEGLAAVRRQGQSLAVGRAIEIGSGTGWASILMSKLGLAREIVAVDMNPQAAAVGRLNAALNGVQNIRFQQSDLLTQLPAELKADLIVACLPQVRKAGNIEGLREVADYYAGGEGYFDMFGLGLIERALEQARGRLQPNGRVLFNLGGRPGRAVLEDLYASQGFRPRLRYAQTIPQDAGTDISSFAAQESASVLRFEFFRPENPNEPITATEALSVERPHHQLYLMEGRPYPDMLRRALDLRLERGGRFGYTAEAGAENTALRESLAPELSREWGLQIHPETLLLGPSSEVLLDGLMRLLPTEKGPVLYAGLGANLMPGVLNRYAPIQSPPNFAAIEAQLNLAPLSVLVLQMPREAWLDRPGLSRLLHTAAEGQIHTIFLEDQPIRIAHSSHPLMEIISRSAQIGEHVHVLQSLDRRYSAPAFPLGLVMSANQGLFLPLSRYADLTHSRASSLTQEVYSEFFQRFGEENLSHENPRGALEPLITQFRLPRELVPALESKPAFESTPKGEHPDPIAMNFGESEWAPRLKLGSLLWDAAQTPRPALESQARQAVVEYLQQSRGVEVRPEQVFLGAGVQPLLVSALRGLREINQGNLHVAVPRPSYGLFFPAIELSGATPVEYSTRPEGRFLTENGQAGREMNGYRAGRFSALLINEPNNPAGQFHSVEQLRAMAEQVRASQGYLLFDDVFGMLDFGRGRQKRTPSMQVLQEALGPRLVSFGGISKEFAAGGLRFGFAVVSDPRLALAMDSQFVAKPDPLALSIAPELMRHWEPLLEDHRLYLSTRAYRLEQVFRERQLPILEAQGGYSVFANLSFLYGRRLRLRSGGEAVIDANNLHELLYNEAGLKIYSDRWARTPDHYRLVFSIDRLDEATDRLRRFFRSAR